MVGIQLKANFSSFFQTFSYKGQKIQFWYNDGRREAKEPLTDILHSKV